MSLWTFFDDSEAWISIFLRLIFNHDNINVLIVNRSINCD